jgi:transposase-like protein
MGKHRKSWSQEEKLTIVKFYQEHGAAKTSKEFNVSTVNIYNWVEIFAKGGSSSLSGSNSTDRDKEILRLQREIQAYKEIIAEKELSLRIKDALLKKSL